MVRLGIEGPVQVYIVVFDQVHTTNNFVLTGNKQIIVKLWQWLWLSWQSSWFRYQRSAV